VNAQVTARADEIRAMVCRVLEVDGDQIGPEDHFVDDLGADSMKLIELLANLEIEFDVEVDPAQFERLTSLEGVHAVLSEALGPGAE
jgi:acyl carrier protein